jgi:predicted MFS family arabinose efflux permease
MLLYSVLISAPAQMTTLVYGSWMQQQFTLTPTMLGIVSIVIGVADLLAELATALFVDRLGKRRSLIVSTAAYAASLAAFWLMAGDFIGALVGLFLVFFSFEFALVTSLAVHTEMVPSARATMAGFVAAAHSVSRMAASLAALPLFLAGSLAAPMLLSVGLIGVAAVMAVGLVKTDDRRRTTDGS